MSGIKKTISLFLFIIYAINFGHAMIPHHHAILDHDQHHLSSTDNCENTSHIFDLTKKVKSQHHDHHDNLLELLSHLFSSVNHPSYESESKGYVYASTFRLAKIDLLNFAYTLHHIITLDNVDDLNANYKIYQPKDYLAPTVINSPRRGPPSISC